MGKNIAGVLVAGFAVIALSGCGGSINNSSTEVIDNSIIFGEWTADCRETSGTYHITSWKFNSDSTFERHEIDTLSDTCDTSGGNYFGEDSTNGIYVVENKSTGNAGESTYEIKLTALNYCNIWNNTCEDIDKTVYTMFSVNNNELIISGMPEYNGQNDGLTPETRLNDFSGSIPFKNVNL